MSGHRHSAMCRNEFCPHEVMTSGTGCRTASHTVLRQGADSSKSQSGVFEDAMAFSAVLGLAFVPHRSVLS